MNLNKYISRAGNPVVFNTQKCRIIVESYRFADYQPTGPKDALQHYT